MIRYFKGTNLEAKCNNGYLAIEFIKQWQLQLPIDVNHDRYCTDNGSHHTNILTIAKNKNIFESKV